MAKIIRMENDSTGQVLNGFYGFSWTTLFFGAFPSLFRSDFKTFIGVFAILVITAIFTAGVLSFILMIVWAFLYNKYYTVNLIKQGFRLAGCHQENQAASSVLGIKLTDKNCITIVPE
ncbi:hypothetical protein [Dongshaea marina]|uniref:hypothetical protein n=1 Tax=Dongshaea marina TaxID=2047966 RepID=UPI000D3E8FB5|nr:hypothetical protein [Dongshaea marina]